MRCTQNVHFSITPFSRTVTSGFSCQFSGSANSYVNQLNTRTFHGQFCAQYRVPTQRLYTCPFSPSGVW